MTKSRYRNIALIICTVALAGYGTVGVVAQPGTNTTSIEKEITAMDAKVSDRSLTKAQRAAFQSDKFISIHGSGWLYTKAENESLGADLMKPTRKAILREQSPQQFLVFNNDAVLETSISTTYYDVPNPQDEARRLGTMGMNGAAMAKAAHDMEAYPTKGPGEGEAPNPYRIRSTRLWVRENGNWKIGMEQATRVGERDHPGY
jgi:hypothetical protein